MSNVILGIIAEYNPFHKGHAYHIATAKAAVRADLVIVCMSGPFTQRGDAALLSPSARAEMAVSCGADLVFEMPALFAVREADAFALGGVAILTALGCTHLSFGCETADTALFEAAAELIQAPTEAFQRVLRVALEKGCSHAMAQGLALEKALNTNALALPNNVLGLCYLRAIHTLKSPLITVPVARLGDYHDSEAPKDDALPSATAVRTAVLNGDWESACRMMPPAAYAVLKREALLEKIHRPHALDSALRLSLLNADEAVLHALPGTKEGLDKLLLKHRDGFLSREDLLQAIKSKRYTYTRLNRLLSHLLLNITQDSLPPLPVYTRLLAAKRHALPTLHKIKKSGFPIIEKAARFNKDAPGFTTDVRAYDLWALGTHLPYGLSYRQSPVIQD